MEHALRGDPDPEIVALEERIRSAQLAADVGALDDLIAGSWRVVGGHVSEVRPIATAVGHAG